MLDVVTRRAVVRGLSAGLPLAAILADPRLARAAADTLETVSISTGGGRTVNAALAKPAQTPAPTVLVIHEWWGLNDQVKSMAAEFAREGCVALAIDLYGGKASTTPDGARSLMQTVNADEATDTLVAWAQWLKAHKASTGKIGTVGWCFGGGWSLNTSIAEPVDATVIYYGKVDRPADQLARLKGPVLGHFATRDGWINEAMVSAFEAAMAAAGKSLTAHRYEANHAFANPTRASYDAADATLAWQRTLDFYRQNLA